MTNQAPKISIVNQSTLFKDADLPVLANALQFQVLSHFYPIHGISARIYYTPTGKNPSPDHWVLALLDDSSQANALGFHDISPDGSPLGKVFVRTTLAANEIVSTTASHELLEMILNPDVNLLAEFDDAQGNASRIYFREACDAVEEDQYTIIIPTGWAGAGAEVVVSNFVTPAFFESFRTTGPFDYLGLLGAPFALSPGGYMTFLDLNNLSAGWQQIMARQAVSGVAEAARKRMAARPHRGSRRERRGIPRAQWVRSTYAPGTEAIATTSIGGQ